MRKNHREMAAGSKLWEIYLSGCLNHLLQPMRNISISLFESFTANYENYIYQFVGIIYCKLWEIYLSVWMNHLLQPMRNISISLFESFTANYEKYIYQFVWIIYWKLWEIYLSVCMNHLLETMRNITISFSESFTTAIRGNQIEEIFTVCAQPHWKTLISVW